MAKKSALVVGILLILIGVIGFNPNLFVGPTGYIQTETTHHLISLVLGAILLVAGFMRSLPSKGTSDPVLNNGTTSGS